jgi:anti-anti-sigma factor
VAGPDEFAVAVETLPGDVLVVRVEGDLDMASAHELESAIETMPNVSRIVIDLTSCTFLDSAGVRVITAVLRSPRSVSLVATDPGVLRVLEITALDTAVPVHATLDAAL